MKSSRLLVFWYKQDLVGESIEIVDFIGNLYYPSLYQLSCEPDSTISQNWKNTWIPLLRRNLQDWEIEDMINLFHRLEGYRPNMQAPDKLR
ncbi:hypothetical protein H5410_009868 [Solanum commersonii]|uniref:Uncharacterized protein n=1 Tax=Solanum commersonii TaxID=4109 RepID=A0A9J6AKQ8_SOLCO|nr:hypothetical protein H5410_009868 [Solanum commersonii]